MIHANKAIIPSDVYTATFINSNATSIWNTSQTNFNYLTDEYSQLVTIIDDLSDIALSNTNAAFVILPIRLEINTAFDKGSETIICTGIFDNAKLIRTTTLQSKVHKFDCLVEVTQTYPTTVIERYIVALILSRSQLKGMNGSVLYQTSIGFFNKHQIS